MMALIWLFEMVPCMLSFTAALLKPCLFLLMQSFCNSCRMKHERIWCPDCIQHRHGVTQREHVARCCLQKPASCMFS